MSALRHAAARGAALVVVCLAGGGALRAQDLLPKGAPQTRPVLLRNGTIHTIRFGTVLAGSLLFDGGKIVGVYEQGKPVPKRGDDVLEIDLKGKDVWPGLIAACSQLGLQEFGMVRQSLDNDEVGDLTPEVVAAVAVNPDSAALPVARRNGVLTACVFPTGGLVPGRASVINLDGWNNVDLTVRAEAGVVVGWPALPEDGPRRFGGRRGGAGAPAGREAALRATEDARRRIEDAFLAARAWLHAKATEPGTATDLRRQALVAAVRGEVPVFVLADELEQIESAVAFAARVGLRMVVVGGRDAALCAPLLVERDVPVIVQGTHKLPRRDDSPVDEPFALPGRLAAAGVRFCIATGDNFANERNLGYHAATAAAYGLDRQRAIAAITADAAEILGVGNRLGALGPDMDATLFVANGDPLDLTTDVELAFVRGRQVDLRSKQTELARKYREKYRQQGLGK